MGRFGDGGGAVGPLSLLDNFAYTGLNTKDLGKGPNRQFSINNGTNLLKLYNDAVSNGLDVVDWGAGTNDSFNQFEFTGVANPVSALDLELMDVIGYDFGVAPVPEPATVFAFGLAAFGLAFGVRRRMAA